MLQRLKNINSYILTGIILVLFDQITKFIFSNIRYANSYFGLVSAKNYGSAFSLFANIQYYPQIISVISIIVIVLLYINRKGFYQNIYTKLSLVTFISGIVGNFIDRILFGYVKDFLFIKDFSIFNFADIYLAVGILLFVYGEFLEYQKRLEKNQKLKNK